eukprot:TRINITY_DN1261_c0_g1_i2.p2 TRINITY_DN1261_c0_g1~~TRINITY_DN1261_c0_g1_i2.p2  ORF type:complete len:205 (+),score=97.08 TRINITY_DN1261_c0_g1_i2:88-702(+)
MSQKGTVRVWNKGYGFAEGTDGKCVFIHKSAIGEDKRLCVGKEINYDIEAVEGHDGRVKGTNVSGPAVMSWEDWKKLSVSREDKDKEREAWESFKKDKLKYEGERKESTEELRVGSNGRGYTRAQFDKHFGETAQAEWDKAEKATGGKGVRRGGKGKGGGKGRGKGPEKRPDTDGGWYSKAQFKQFYNGYEEWDISGRMIGRVH